MKFHLDNKLSLPFLVSNDCAHAMSVIQFLRMYCLGPVEYKQLSVYCHQRPTASLVSGIGGAVLFHR